MNKLLEQYLEMVLRLAWLVVPGYLLLACLSLYYAFNNVGINTDTAALLDQNLPFLQLEQQLSERFPVFGDTILAVIEGTGAERVRDQARRVHQAIAQHPRLYPEVFWPPAQPWFREHALLYRDSEELQQLTDRLAAAQPFLTALAAETNAATLLRILSRARQQSDTTLQEAMAPLQQAIAGELLAITGAAAVAGAPLDWRQLLSGGLLAEDDAQSGETHREIIVIQPYLDESRVKSAERAMAGLRQVRRNLDLSAGPEAEVSMRITGPVALKHEELLSALNGSILAGSLALVMVAVLLWIALRSLLMVFAALLVLTAGFMFTTGFAAWAVQEINLISIAFVVLYIGLGINYSIHFILRYQEQLRLHEGQRQAVCHTGRLLMAALTLSAVTTLAGFFAFIPTSYQGVAQLGLIAGGSMPITLITHYTLMPALLKLLPPPAALPERPVISGHWIDAPRRQRRAILVTTGVLAAGAVVLLPHLRFDSDPLNLRDQDSESVLAIRSLLDDGGGDFRSLATTATGREQAQELADRLRQLDSVARVLTAESLIPRQQETKLWQLEDLRIMVGPRLVNHQWAVDEVSSDALFASANALLQALPDDAANGELRTALQQLQDQAGRTDDRQALAAAVNRQLLAGLPEVMEQLQQALAVAAPVQLADLPGNLRSQWIADDGTWLIRIYPAANANRLDELEAFANEVRQVTPNVAGGTIKQIEAGHAISESFRQALLLALAAITILLLALLRSLATTLKVLAPLLVGGILIMAGMVLLDLPLNYANIIALPLLLGVAVDNGIHLVWRHRLGGLPQDNVLRTATARAIVFAGLTTAVSFGNLGFSDHAGTASMGVLLAGGLAIMLVCTLIVLPALLSMYQRPR